MAKRLSVIKIGTALAIVVACPICLATATGTIAFNASAAQNWAAWLAGSRREQAASLANAVDMVKPAVIAVRAKRPAVAGAGSDADEPGAGGPLDEQHGKSSPPSTRRRGSTSVGSGFFVTADGYAVTNNHVTEGSETAEIIADDQKTYTAKVVGTDPATDIALLKVDGRNDFTSVKIADKGPRVGDRIFAVGNPFGLGGTVTAGIVSARDRSVTSDDRASRGRSGSVNAYEDLIQIDASINRGNSGGPSFDAEGNVIGVNTMIFSPTGGSIGIGFAIPAETANAIVAQLKEKGSVTRGWFGVQFQSLTPTIADVLGLKEAHGALVAEALPDGPASKAGIMAGDVIDSINGEAIKDNSDLSRRMIGLAPGLSIKLGVSHNGEEKTVAVTLGEPPGTKGTRRAHPTQTVTPPASDLGLKLAPFIDATAENRGVERQGLVVLGIDPAGRAADLGVELGDIILEVSGKAVQTPDDIRSALDEARGAGRHAALMRVKSGEAVRFVAVPVDPA
jgi:serine protease Do